MKSILSSAKRFTATIALLAVLLPSAALAVPYDVNTMGTFLGTTAGNNPSGGYYKFDVPATESGSAAGVFSTVISNAGKTATITWTGPQPVLSLLYLKAGPNYDTWNINSFNLGVFDSIVVTNSTLLNPGGQIADISHVEITPGAGVPDGGSTVALLGLALAGLALIRRKFSA